MQLLFLFSKRLCKVLKDLTNGLFSGTYESGLNRCVAVQRGADVKKSWLG